MTKNTDKTFSRRTSDIRDTFWTVSWNFVEAGWHIEGSPCAMIRVRPTKKLAIIRRELPNDPPAAGTNPYWLPSRYRLVAEPQNVKVGLVAMQLLATKE